MRKTAVEVETVDRIEQTSRGFAVVLAAMLGAQALCEDMGPLVGPWGTLLVLLAVGLSWHAPILRGCLQRKPRLFTAVISACVIVMTLAFLLSPHAQAFPFVTHEAWDRHG